LNKKNHLVYVLAAGLFLLAYAMNADLLRSYSFYLFGKASATGTLSNKVMLVSGPMGLHSYNLIFSRMKKNTNSVAVFISGIFRQRAGDLIGDVALNELDEAKEEYRQYSIALAETDNIIPVLLGGTSGFTGLTVELGAYGYFNASKLGFKPLPFSGDAANRRLWTTVHTAAFYPDYKYYPYVVPVLFSKGEDILVSAPVEAVRKYYKLTKNRVRIENGRLRIGDTVDCKLLDYGEIALPYFSTPPRIYTLDEFLAMPEADTQDKIIIIKDLRDSAYTMLSMAAAVSSIMEGMHLGYDPLVNYAGALVFMGIAFMVFMRSRFWPGFFILLFLQTAAAGLVYWLIISGYYADYAALTVACLTAFFTVHYYRNAAKHADAEKRAGLLQGVLPPKLIKKFIATNMDVKIKNSWIAADVLYFMFDPERAAEPAVIKKDFEKLSALIYNDHKEFFARYYDNGDASFVLLSDGAGPKKVLETLLVIREKLQDADFNIFLCATEVYIFEYDGRLIFTDRNAGLKINSEVVGRKRNILVPEKDIQKYINIAKFQQVTGGNESRMFNISGLREEAQDEN
jgi:hypothetical protein